jgi:hypothetical protein
MRAGKFEPDLSRHPERSEGFGRELSSTGSGPELVEGSRTDLASEPRRFVAFAQSDDNIAMVDRLGVLVRRARVARLRAVFTAENVTVGFNAVADHATVTMAALRRKRVNGALETVENVFPGFTFDSHFKRLLIFVSANFTACHDRPPNSFESSRPIRFAYTQQHYRCNSRSRIWGVFSVGWLAAAVLQSRPWQTAINSCAA